MDGQGTKWRKNITENVNRLSGAYERYRQTDRRQTDSISEHERELTFAKNILATTNANKIKLTNENH